MKKGDWIVQLFDSIDAKDTPAFLSFLSENASFRFGSNPAVRGRAYIGQAVDGFFSTIKSSRHDIFNTWSDTDTTICQGEVTYVRYDDSEVTVPFTDIFEMQDGKINAYLIYIDVSPLYASAD